MATGPDTRVPMYSYDWYWDSHIQGYLLGLLYKGISIGNCISKLPFRLMGIWPMTICSCVQVATIGIPACNIFQLVSN